MTTTVLEKYNVDFADPTLPVLTNDSTNITTIADDFTFDYKQALSYVAGSVPADAAFVTQLANLANDDCYAISRSGIAVTADQYDAANKSTLSTTKGWQCSATKKGLLLAKTGGTQATICAPALEGFVDFLVIAWVRLVASGAAVQSPFMCGSSGGANPDWGFQNLANGYTTEVVTGSVVVAALPTDESLHMLAAYYKFNTGAGTSQVSTWYDGQIVSNLVTGRATASYIGTNGNRRVIIGNGNGLGIFNGAVARVRRVFVGLSGQTAAEIVAAEYAANVGRL